MSRYLVDFRVYGVPAPGGSKKAFVLRRANGEIVRRANGCPVVNVTDAAGEKNKNWRQSVAAAGAQAWAGRPLLTDLLEVWFEFYFPRPKGHYGTGKNAGVLKASAPGAPGGAPDVLKCSRAAEDALTAIVWRDDSLIVREHLAKDYATPDNPPGCRVRVAIWRPEGQFLMLGDNPYIISERSALDAAH